MVGAIMGGAGLGLGAIFTLLYYIDPSRQEGSTSVRSGSYIPNLILPIGFSLIGVIGLFINGKGKSLINESRTIHFKNRNGKSINQHGFGFYIKPAQTDGLSLNFAMTF